MALNNTLCGHELLYASTLQLQTGVHQIYKCTSSSTAHFVASYVSTTIYHHAWRYARTLIRKRSHNHSMTMCYLSSKTSLYPNSLLKLRRNRGKYGGVCIWVCYDTYIYTKHYYFRLRLWTSDHIRKLIRGAQRTSFLLHDVAILKKGDFKGDKS